MSDVMVNSTSNGQALLSVAGARTSPPRYQQILSHLRSGKAITNAEASEEYDCDCLPAVVCNLRQKGWFIITERFRTEQGERCSRYRLIEEPIQSDDDSEIDAVDEEMDLFTIAPVAALPLPEVAQETAPPEMQTRSIHAIAVRMGAGGPELQVIPVGGHGSEFFYSLSPAQVRYLLLNLGMFAAE